MKKHFLSMLLLFVFVLGLGSPAAAYNAQKNLDDLELVEVGEIKFPSQPETAADASDLSRARVPDLYLLTVAAAPIVYVDGMDAAFILADAARFASYGPNSGYPQFGVIRLTSKDLASVNASIQSFMNRQPDLQGKKFMIAGWRLEGLYRYAAQRPHYFEYEGDSDCLNSPNPYRENVSATTGNHIVMRDFQVQNFDNSVYYRLGISGGFYFTNDGHQGSAGLGVSLIVNSDK